MSKLKTAIKYGTAIGAGVCIGYTVGVATSATDSNQPQPGSRSMGYEVGHAKHLVSNIGEQIETLEQLGLNNEVQHLVRASQKLERGIKEAEDEGREHVDVQITGDEFAAWLISILGSRADNNGTGRR